MIEFLEPLFIPNVGGYNHGDHAQLDATLESQLVMAGKAKFVEAEKAEVVATSGGVGWKRKKLKEPVPQMVEWDLAEED